MRKISSVAMFRVSDEDQSAPHFGLPNNVLRIFDGGGARLTCMHICSSALFLPSELDVIQYFSLIRLPTPLVSLLSDIFPDTTPWNHQHLSRCRRST